MWTLFFACLASGTRWNIQTGPAPPPSGHADGGEIGGAALIEGAVEDLRPEVGQLAGVGTVETDREECDTHGNAPFSE